MPQGKIPGFLLPLDFPLQFLYYALEIVARSNHPSTFNPYGVLWPFENEAHSLKKGWGFLFVEFPFLVGSGFDGE